MQIMNLKHSKKNKMDKQNMLIVSAKVAEQLLGKGVTERAMRKMTKTKLVDEFSELHDLIEVEEAEYENWAKHNKEEKSLNYFKSLVAFDMVYIQRKK
jgi:hypothetical protein